MSLKKAVKLMNEHVVADISFARLLTMITTAIGPQIMQLLNDPEVIEILANSDGNLWVEKLGQDMVLHGRISPDAAMQVIKLVAGSIKAECNADNPSIGAELVLDGSRFHGLIPPIVKRPCFTIRKKALRIITLDEYVQEGCITPNQKDRILYYIEKKKNILVVGGVSSGKTTFLNGILHAIGETKDRIIIIEDTRELQCDAPNSEFFRSNKKYTMDLLLTDALRFRPDRIIVGEVRSKEALTLLDAWNTGHPGGLATIHADSAEKGLRRMEQLIQRVVSSPQQETIADAVNVIIFLQKQNKLRMVKEILEVQEYKKGYGYVFKDVS